MRIFQDLAAGAVKGGYWNMCPAKQDQLLEARQPSLFLKRLRVKPPCIERSRRSRLHACGLVLLSIEPRHGNPGGVPGLSWPEVFVLAVNEINHNAPCLAHKMHYSTVVLS